MEKLPFSDISIFVDNKKICVDEDGFFGNIIPTNQLQFKLEIMNTNEYRTQVFKVFVDQPTMQRRIIGLESNVTSSDSQLFVRDVSILESPQPQGVYYPSKRDAGLCVLFYGPADFHIYEIALISQGGKFFLTSQKIYGGECFSFEDSAFAVDLLKRNRERIDLLGLLSILAEKNDIKFPKINEEDVLQMMNQSSEKENAKLDVSDLKKNQARILFWSHSNLWGIVAVSQQLTEQGLARVHWSQLAPRTKNGLAYLNPGEIINFATTRDAHKGLFGTSIDLELLSIFSE
ncbi:MAG: hypothetical protein COU51_01650 [Parcubacteria group bacterium CG10_big_fil_rev_8_21_14_0_10_36_14]|nr:MAG: hypothetical protein COU51_01650 [Parcubacteria group bacterium CG10_big_fil_rev_8_21_14_0_10_36_14]